METELRTEAYLGSEEEETLPVSPSHPIKGFQNPDFGLGDFSGWTAEGDPFRLIQGEDGNFILTSYDVDRERGEEAKGLLWQEFRVDSSMKYLCFSLFGGHGSVELFHGEDLVRRSFGPRSHQNPRKVRWSLDSLQGEWVRLIIEDKHDGKWGFITVRGFSIETN